MTTELKRAIDRSQNHNEIVIVDYDGSREDLMVALDGFYDGEIDDAQENDGTIDVWGYDADAPEGEMEWRIKVRLPVVS